MKFTPLTDQELQMQGLLPEGIYSYEVSKCEDKVSKAGKDYLSLTLRLWDVNGAERLIFTNLAFIKLLKHFCDVNNMQEVYQSGEISADNLLHKSGGAVLIGIEGEKPNPAGGFYAAKNVVKDYIVTPQKSLSHPIPETNKEFVSDDLPF